MGRRWGTGPTVDVKILLLGQELGHGDRAGGKSIPRPDAAPQTAAGPYPCRFPGRYFRPTGSQGKCAVWWTDPGLKLCGELAGRLDFHITQFGDPADGVCVVVELRVQE